MSDALTPEETARQARHLALLGAYRDVFESPAGRMVLLDLLREGGVLITSFEPGDPHFTAFKDGRRSLALTILDRLRWTEGELLHLAQQKEAPAFNPIAPDVGMDQPDLPDNGVF